MTVPLCAEANGFMYATSATERRRIWRRARKRERQLARAEVARSD